MPLSHIDELDVVRKRLYKCRQIKWNVGSFADLLRVVKLVGLSCRSRPTRIGDVLPREVRAFTLNSAISR